MKDPELWARIAASDPGDIEADFSFSARLARECCWTQGHARHVIREYQRFVYLSRLSPHPVTPSDEVDQAWHLHLTYTRHYWGPFKAALGGPLHHMPTRGGADQANLFRHLYRQTLELYRSEFGEPPADIWPDVETRFSRPQHLTRVNRHDYWMIPKPKCPAFASRILKHLASIPAPVLRTFAVLAVLGIGTRLAFAHGVPHGDSLPEMLLNMVHHWLTEHTFEFFIFSALGAFLIFLVYGFWKGIFGDASRSSGTGCNASGGGGDSGCSSGCAGCGGGGGD
ncbi:hypothetical protein FMN50_20135 [Rhodobacterales bacterium]|nr:hypothetical protein FMN50_20135 [Rhodobacterales bacterium]